MAQEEGYWEELEKRNSDGALLLSLRVQLAAAEEMLDTIAESRVPEVMGTAGIRLRRLMLEWKELCRATLAANKKEEAAFRARLEAKDASA